MDKYNKKALETLHDSKSRGLTGIQIHEEANNQKVVSKNKKRKCKINDGITKKS